MREALTRGYECRYGVVPVDVIERLAIAVRLAGNDIPRSKLEGVHGALEELTAVTRTSERLPSSAHHLAEEMATALMNSAVVDWEGLARDSVVAEILPFCTAAGITEESLEAARLHVEELREMVAQAETLLKRRCFHDTLTGKAPAIPPTSTVQEAYAGWVLHHPSLPGLDRSWDLLPEHERSVFEALFRLQEIEGASLLNENALRLVHEDLVKMLGLPDGTSLSAALAALCKHFASPASPPTHDPSEGGAS